MRDRSRRLGDRETLVELNRLMARLDAFERDEKMLVDDARILSFAHFTRVIAYWAQHADPEGSEDRAEHDRDARRVHLSQSFGGMWHGDMLLDPICGQIVYEELSRLEIQMFEAEWAELRQRLGEGASVDDLLRPASQRRADALAEMASRSRTAPACGRRPEPLFTVLVDYQTGRSHRAVERRRRHHHQERPDGLCVPQPKAQSEPIAEARW